MPPARKARIESATDIAIEKAATLLKSGELIAFPTETVYGLGADAENTAAVEKIFIAKQRPHHHPLIVHVASIQDAGFWAEMTPEAETLFSRFSPGALTLILRRKPKVSDAVTGGQESVGVRIPSHPVAQKLLQAFSRLGGHGIAAPSANRFGHVSPTSAQHVAHDLGEETAMILDGGAATHGIESTIVALLDRPVLIRPGAIERGKIEAALNAPLAHAGDLASTPRASGTLLSHYAPQTPAHIVAAGALDKTIAQERLKGRRVALLLRAHTPFRVEATERVIRLPMSAEEYARGLYAALRTLDFARADILLIESVPDAPEWEGVTDRLTRATN
ncbi:MAG: threonylcarbamoyl-AMP synthase [Burkholderiales bacterium]|nr:threonylcarbamoyl-AMP synthase [Burkholderiales bacterium]